VAPWVRSRRRRRPGISRDFLAPNIRSSSYGTRKAKNRSRVRRRLRFLGRPTPRTKDHHHHHRSVRKRGVLFPRQLFFEIRDISAICDRTFRAIILFTNTDPASTRVRKLSTPTLLGTITAALFYPSPAVVTRRTFIKSLDRPKVVFTFRRGARLERTSLRFCRVRH